MRKKNSNRLKKTSRKIKVWKFFFANKLSIDVDNEKNENRKLSKNESIAKFICELMNESTKYSIDWEKTTSFW